MTFKPLNHSKENYRDDNLVPPPKQVGKWFSSRYCLAYLAFWGFATNFALRVSLSVAVLSMVNNTILEENQDLEPPAIVCPKDSFLNITKEDGEFTWDEEEVGFLLSSFFYGYVVTGLLGGYLSAKYGGKWIFGGGTFCASFLSLFTPLAAKTSFNLLIALRILEGLVSGVISPSIHSMWGRWAPPIERSFLVSFSYAGSQLGTVLSQPLSSLLSSSIYLEAGLQFFMFLGSLGILWSFLWFLFAYSSPEEHPYISDEELKYIQSTISSSKITNNVPWFRILTSKATWAIAISHFCNNWGFYTLLTCLPMYLKDILQFDISKSGFLAALPYFVMWISINISGWFADKVREKSWLNTSQTRKTFNSIGLIGPAIFLVFCSLVGCNQSAAIACICAATSLNAFVYSGCNANHIDLSPKYAGILMGISHTIANIAGFIAPDVVGNLTEKNNTREQWKIVFFIAAGVYVFGALIFVLFSSGDEQEWNKDEDEPLINDKSN